MKIATASDLFGAKYDSDPHKWLMSRGSVRKRSAQLNVRPSRIGKPDDPDINAKPAVAYVNHGRWVADCPSEYCNGAMAIQPGHPFMCGNCLNAETGHKYRLVAWPKQRGVIEETLSMRPVPEVANWLPTESVGDLRNQNAAHRIGVR